MNDPVFHYFGNKAGVEGADQVKQIIDQVTKGSDYYKKQQEKRDLYIERINKMKGEIQNYKKSQTKQTEIKEIIKTKQSQLIHTTDRIWAHFDMDMFYVACELLDKPELKNQPVAVGGSQIISTANYVARKFGVRSAMPTFVAKKLCPELVVLGSNFDKYKNVSNIFMRILKEYDPELESMGMDEANLDLTSYVSLNEITDLSQLCESIRNKIFISTNLTVSCGVGPNKMVAKLASEKNKPDGLYVVPQNVEEVSRFIAEMPVRKIPGIGTVTEQILDGLDFKTCQDIRDRADELYMVLTNKTFEFIFESCWGCSRNQHVEFEDQQSVSCSRTFKGTSNQLELEQKLTEIADMLSEDLISQDRVGLHLTLIIKTCKFELKNKSIQLPSYCNQQFIQYGKSLLRTFQPFEPIRLLGLKMGQLKYQKDLEKHSIQQFLNPQSEKLSENEQQLEDPQRQESKKKSLQPKFIICPICNKEIETRGNNVSLNKHIDKCLGGEPKTDSIGKLDQFVKKTKKK